MLGVDRAITYNRLFHFICFYFSKIALLVTDGKQTPVSAPSEPSADDVSTAIKLRGISIYSMGIGAVDPIELARYSSSFEVILNAPDFAQLDAKALEQAELLCPSKLNVFSVEKKMFLFYYWSFRVQS